MVPWLWLLALWLSLSPLSGQEAPPVSEKEVPETSMGGLSVNALRRAGQGRDLVWRPDWSPAMPPDAFTLLADVSVGAVTLTLEGEEYRVRRGGAGYFALFPVCLEGGFSQAQAVFDDAGTLKGIRVQDNSEDGEGSLDMEGLGYSQDALPALVRVSRGGDVYFAVLEYGHDRVSETWYDLNGGALAVLITRFSGGVEELLVTDLGEGTEKLERYDYDSSGNITEINSPAGTFTALYDRNSRPRYWERRPAEAPEDGGDEAPGSALPPEDSGGKTAGAYTLQWDEKGLLIRVTGHTGAEAADYRYEYTLDERGNWTERREIRMVPRAGFLVPVPGTTVSRVIEYGADRPGVEP
jgi:YD repeat-containing protein